MTLLGVLARWSSLLNLEIFGRQWELHSLIGGALLTIVGTQVAGARAVRARLRLVLHG